MSQIKNLFFDELNRIMQGNPTMPMPLPVHLAPPLPKGLHSADMEHEGVDLLVYYDFMPEQLGSTEPLTGLKLEPDYPASVTILHAYVRDVDILPLLPFTLIDELEGRLLRGEA